MGIIHSIVYQPAKSDLSEQPRFNRVPIAEANLIANHGIDGDRKAGRHPKRHLNLMMRETLDTLADCGYQTDPGQMGEQLQVSGIDIESLAPDTLLKIGETAIIRLNKPRTGCVWLEKIQGKPCVDTEGKLGIMASVLVSGSIHVGDNVDIVTSDELETSVEMA